MLRSFAFIYFYLATPGATAGSVLRLNLAWQPCNIGKLGQDNEDYYYYNIQGSPARRGLSKALNSSGCRVSL
jgi:hypothetical protein